MIPALFLLAALVDDVRTFIDRRDMASAQRQVQAYRARSGVTPELAVAVSWMARGELALGNRDKADTYAAEARKLSEGLLRGRKLDAEPLLATAVGAGIEVHGQVLAARGELPEAVGYLRDQLRLFAGTSLVERIRKNINLLNLEGKPAPELNESEWLGAKPAPPLASLHGHPILLFFWAHWCVDCKALGPQIANLVKIYATKGLILITPTKRYGYAAGGEDAPPGAEKLYINKVRHDFYPALLSAFAPLSEANFQTYGASTVPTLVLIDRAGLVRYYHPGTVTESELAAQIRSVL